MKYTLEQGCIIAFCVFSSAFFQNLLNKTAKYVKITFVKIIDKR